MFEHKVADEMAVDIIDPLEVAAVAMTTTIDPSQFHQVFFEESLEGLEAMEPGLVTLVPGAASAEDVNALFRVAHTLRGGSATFGFGDIAAFSHRVEGLPASSVAWKRLGAAGTTPARS